MQYRSDRSEEHSHKGPAHLHAQKVATKLKQKYIKIETKMQQNQNDIETAAAAPAAVASATASLETTLETASKPVAAAPGATALVSISFQCCCIFRGAQEIACWHYRRVRQKYIYIPNLSLRVPCASRSGHSSSCRDRHSFREGIRFAWKFPPRRSQSGGPGLGKRDPC